MCTKYETCILYSHMYNPCLYNNNMYTRDSWRLRRSRIITCANMDVVDVQASTDARVCRVNGWTRKSICSLLKTNKRRNNNNKNNAPYIQGVSGRFDKFNNCVMSHSQHFIFLFLELKLLKNLKFYLPSKKI